MHPDTIQHTYSIPTGYTAIDAATQRILLYNLLLIRRFEEKIVALYGEQEMKTPVHLYIGQEAVAAGVCANLDRQDVVFSNHRSHGHYLAKGGSAERLAAELYGKVTGCSGGKGGSMHVIDTEAGVCGTSAIVGGGIPLATGAALAFSLRNEPRVSVAFFGDGASEEGVFAESLSLAALKQLPVVFVLENNFYATCSPIANRRSVKELYKQGIPYDIPSIRIDGNDAGVVYAASREAVARARSGKGPSLVEAVTCRWKGHVGPSCDLHNGYRSACELDAWKERCPLTLFRERYLPLLPDGEQVWQQLETDVAGVVEAAFRYAQASPFPDVTSLLTNVW